MSLNVRLTAFVILMFEDVNSVWLTFLYNRRISQLSVYVLGV